MRLSRLLVIVDQDDREWMQRVAYEALLASHPGLPGHMLSSLQQSAELVLRDCYWTDYVFVCLVAVQARPGGEEETTIRLRQELEQIFFELLFGPTPSAEEARRLGTPRRAAASRR